MKNARKVHCSEQTTCALFALCTINVLKKLRALGCLGRLIFGGEFHVVFCLWGFFSLIVFYTKIPVLVYHNTNISVLVLVLFTQMAAVERESVIIQNRNTEPH